MKIVVQVIKVGNITNNVNVIGTGHDTNLTNNNDSVSVSVPDLSLIHICNYTKLVIKDTLPQGFEYIGAGAFYANGTKSVSYTHLIFKSDSSADWGYM